MNWSPRSTNVMFATLPRSVTSSKIRRKNASISSAFADLHRDVVDADEPRHAASVTRARPARPDARELDDRRGSRRHVLHARPLAHRVVFLAAGEEVRRRQAARRAQRRPCPACDRERRLHPARRIASSAASTTRGLCSMYGRMFWYESRTFDSECRPRLAGCHVRDEAFEQRQVLFEQRVVVVAGDEVDDRLLDVAGDPVWMEEPPRAPPGRARREPVGGERLHEPSSELDRVHELALRGARVHRQPVDRSPGSTSTRTSRSRVPRARSRRACTRSRPRTHRGRSPPRPVPPPRRR